MCCHIHTPPWHSQSMEARKEELLKKPYDKKWCSTSYTINSLWVVFIYTKASNCFNNPIGRDDKHLFIDKEIKLIELKWLVQTDTESEWLKRELEFHVSNSWIITNYCPLQVSCLFDSVLGFSFLLEMGCLLMLTLAVVYRETQFTILILIIFTHQNVSRSFVKFHAH